MYLFNITYNSIKQKKDYIIHIIRNVINSNLIYSR